MSRLVRISLCLVLLSLPLAGLQAQPSRCGDGIRAGSQCHSGCCCPDPTACYCHAPAKPQGPSTDHSAVRVPSHCQDDTAVLVPIAHGASLLVGASIQAVDSHAIQVHPEKLLARLHVLQI